MRMSHEDSGVIKTHPLMDSQSTGLLGEGQNLKGDASLKEVVCALKEDILYLSSSSFLFSFTPLCPHPFLATRK